MNYSEILKRTDLNYLENFILNGLDGEGPVDYKTYSERLMEADNKASDFLRTRFPVLKEYDQIMAYYYDQTGVIQEVYFEIGLIVGGKIALEISKRMEELK